MCPFFIGTCWDEDDVITNCRYCQVEFGLVQRKHHCRSCGGIFCSTCNPAGAVTITSSPVTKSPEATEASSFYIGKYVGRKDPRKKSDSDSPSQESIRSSDTSTPSTPPVQPVVKDEGFWLGKYVGRPNPNKPKTATTPSLHKNSDDGSRCCIGCRMAETPCDRIKMILKDEYNNVMATRSAARPVADRVVVNRGSLYGEGKVMVRQDGQDAHSSGYIEILNKGDFVFCVKIFGTMSDIYRESCRPSYVPGIIRSTYLCIPTYYVKLDDCSTAGRKGLCRSGPCCSSC